MSDYTLTEAERVDLRVELVANGLEDLHSWRCAHPDRYGPCGCVEEFVNDLADWIAARLIATHREQAARDALNEAADEMSAVIADGDVAEVAAFVPGEVGRSEAVSRRDALYEQPHEWLREYAARAAVTQGGDEA